MTIHQFGHFQVKGGRAWASRQFCLPQVQNIVYHSLSPNCFKGQGEDHHSENRSVGLRVRMCRKSSWTLSRVLGKGEKASWITSASCDHFAVDPPWSDTPVYGWVSMTHKLICADIHHISLELLPTALCGNLIPLPLSITIVQEHSQTPLLQLELWTQHLSWFGGQVTERTTGDMESNYRFWQHLMECASTVGG